MARPMILIRQDLLYELWDKHVQGVPICKLIAIYELNITPPTLTKLIRYLNTAMKADKKIRSIINASLFPFWVDDIKEDLAKQPMEYVYRGTMPLGSWEKR